MPSRPTCFIAPPSLSRRAIAGGYGRLASLSLAVMLAGCAAQTAYKDGKDLVEQNKVEAGLSKFQEAMTADPRNPTYKSAYVQTRERILLTELDKASRLAAAGRHAEAEKQYQRVLEIDPNNEQARAGLQNLETSQRHGQLIKEAEKALEKNDLASSRLKLSAVLSENPRNERAQKLERAIDDRAIVPPVAASLASSFKKPISIEFRDAQLKQVFEVIALSAGLNFVFDKDVKTDEKTSIFLKNSTVESAIYMLLLTNQLEQQVLDANTILIYPNTEAKQKDYQERVVKSFFLTNADAKTVANTVKTIVKSRDIVVDEKLNMIIVRDSAEAIKLTEKLVALHDAPEPEVMLEVEILEVKRSRLLDLGIQWPSSLTLSTAGTSLEALRSSLSDITDKKLIVGGSPVTLKAQKTDSDTNLLANPRIRTRNREKAKIVIGEKVPIISTTTQLNGGSPISSEMITYIDVGLKLEVEPTVYLDNEVAIKVALEVSNLGAEVPTASGSSAYRIGTRNASTVLRLKDGENQILAGLINDEDRQSANKIPGLGDIPLIGRLFGSSVNNNDKTEILLSITPRILRNIQRPTNAQAEFRSGTDTGFRSAPDTSQRIPVAAPIHAPTSATPPLRLNPPPSAVPPASQPGAVNTQQAAPAAAAAPASGAPHAFLAWTGPTQFKVGDQFDAQLVMESQQPVASLSMSIGFDPRVLQVVGIAEHDFFKKGGMPTTFSSEVDQGGKILVKAARVGDGAMQGATGPGVVANVSFRAIAPSPATRVQLVSMTPVDVAGRTIGMPSVAPHTVSVQR